MSESEAIICAGLSKTFRRKFRKSIAVSELDLVIPRGSVYGLLGPNGAGKTTTINMILGIIRQSAGTVRVLGGAMSSATIRDKIGYVPEKFALPTHLSARELLSVHSKLLTASQKTASSRVNECLELVDLHTRADDRIKTFSKGMQQRLAIAIAILGNPELLILDEPTSALDPIGRKQVRALIEHVNATGTTVVLNSHLLAEVESVCDHVAILNRGKLLRHGTVEELRNSGVTVTISVRGDAADFIHALQSFSPTVIEPAHVTNTYPDDTTTLRMWLADLDAVPPLATRAQECGLELYALTPEHENLESLFMRLVDGAE